MPEFITKTFNENQTLSTATFSKCFKYRYSLTKKFNTGKGKLLFILLNPSKATDQAAINLEQISKLSEKSDKLHRDIGKLLFAIAEEAQLEIIRKGNQFEEDLEDWRTGDSINGEDFNQKFEEALLSLIHI